MREGEFDNDSVRQRIMKHIQFGEGFFERLREFRSPLSVIANRKCEFESTVKFIPAL